MFAGASLVALVLLVLLVLEFDEEAGLIGSRDLSSRSLGGVWDGSRTNLGGVEL